MVNGYAVKRTDIFLGRELRNGEPASNTFVRLARRNSGNWVRPVHEVWNVGADAHTFENPLVHYSARSVSQFISKLNIYSDQNAKYLHSCGVRVSWWHIIAFPLGKFLRNYILMQGFRDGTHGFVHAMSMSMHSFLTRAKLFLLWQHIHTCKAQD
jgi:hypothetical protein